MKNKFLSFVSIVFLGASAVPMMGASACTYTTVSQDGTVRVESDGHVRINRGRFCVRARAGADYITGSAWLDLRYRVGGDRRTVGRQLSLSGRDFDCKTVTFSQPVEIQDVKVVLANLEYNGRKYRQYEIVDNRYVESAREATQYIEFQLGDQHSSNDVTDPEVRYALRMSGTSEAGVSPLARTSDEDNAGNGSASGTGEGSAAAPLEAAI